MKIQTNQLFKKTYEAGQLKEYAVGYGRSPFDINKKQKGGVRLFEKRKNPSMFGGKGFICPQGHTLIQWKHGEHERWRACLLKKLCWSCLKFVLLSVIIISSSLAIYMHYKGSAYNPIREIQRLNSESRRDDALDRACFFIEYQTDGA